LHPRGKRHEKLEESFFRIHALHSVGNKQEELEATVQQDSYDLVTITETWWDDSHDWSAAVNGYKVFRRGR